MAAMRGPMHGAGRRGLLFCCPQHDAFRDVDTAGSAAPPALRWDALALRASRMGAAMTRPGPGRAVVGAWRGARRWLGATRRGSALLPLWAVAWAMSGRFEERLRQRRMARVLAASGRFDSAYYRAAYPDAGDPLWDYVTRGRHAARNPNATFDAAYYLAMNPEVAAQGIDPFIHYLHHGEAEGRRPLSPLGGVASPAAAADARDQRADTALVVHLAHPELWPELLSFIRSVPSPYDLHVTVAGEAAFRAVAGTILASVPDAVIHVVPCRGRDMAPFLALLGGPLATYRYVCKIHAQTAAPPGGQERRLELLRALLGSRGHVRRIKALFDAAPKLGLIGPAGFRARHDPAHEANARPIAQLCGALGIAPRDVAADFFAGAMVWVRPAALAPLAHLHLGTDAFEPEAGQDSGTLAHALERMLNTVVRLAGFRVVDTSAVDLSAAAVELSEAQRPEAAAVAASRVKLIAFYRPEFHWDRDPARKAPARNARRRADPWLEVAQARPLFAGHVQPRLPSELGFADLGVAEVRAAQAALAARHGVHGFCYRYEWFNGVARHGRPLAEMIASGAPDFPFCLVWPCPRKLDPRKLGQPRGRGELAPDFAAAFIADVLPALRDRRCVRWNGRPVLLIEGIASLPAPEATAALWRDHARAAGLGEIHLCAVSGDDEDRARTAAVAAAADFDAVVAMPLLDASSDAGGLHDMTGDLPGRAASFGGPVYDYAAIAARDLVRGAAAGGLRQHRGLLAGHDDSPRTGKGPVVHGASPAEYGRWLEGAIEQERAAEPAGDVLIFVASWNDWAGGAVLEPDVAHGRGFLAATAAALGKTPRRVGTRARARHSDASPGAPLH